MRNITALLTLTVVMVMSTNMAVASNSEQPSMGEFEITNVSGNKQAALLLSTKVSGEINGLVASITIEQSFSNQQSGWVHGRYVFPLPEAAAVNKLQVQIGERIIEGEVQEKQLAKRNFEAAKKAGKKGGLLEQHRANLFSVNIANIGPGETITTKLTYVDQVEFKDDLFQLKVPTTLTPRYITGRALTQRLISDVEANTPQIIDAGSGWARNTTIVDDASKITPPQSYSVQNSSAHNYPTQIKVSHQFDLLLSIDPGLPSNGIDSPSHTLNSSFVNSNTIEVSLRDGSAPLDRDLILRWQLRDEAATQAAIFTQNKTDSDNHFSMVMVTPPTANIQALPRDITFIIDTSGSMGGISIQQAKLSLLLALSELSVNDRFNVIEFNSHFNPLFRQPRMATERHLSMARGMVNQLHADGGTEMFGALDFALKQASNTDYLRQIVFITDGSIGNEQELFKLIDTQLNDARLFTVSIGSAPNSYFMRKAAKFGRGFYTHISQLNEVKDKIALLSEKIKRPVMRNISVEWPGDVELYPKNVPDLYAGEPLRLLARSAEPIKELIIRGDLGGQSWQQHLRSAQASSGDNELERDNAAHLDTLWSRAKVESLMDSLVTNPQELSSVREKIIALGTRFNLVTKFTSFIAVEKKISRSENESAKHENVPNLMPHGSTMQAPATATSAQFLQLFGGLLLLLALLLKRAPGFRWPAEIT